MSFAVELATAPPSVFRRIRAALCVFAASGCAIAVAQLQPVDAWAPVAVRSSLPAVAVAVPFVVVLVLLSVVLAALFLALASAIARRGRAAPLPAGRLVVDAAGDAAWRPLGGEAAAPEPVAIERWYVLGSFAWIAVRFAGDRRARDLLLVHGADESAWRRLRAWLVWYGRGRVARSPIAAAGS